LAPAVAQTGGATTTRVSITNGGQQGNDHSGPATVSDDGRYVVFESVSTNLVAQDNNGVADIFLRDRTAGTTTRLSVNSSNKQSNGHSRDPIISGNGRYVVFFSSATNLVSGDRNRQDDVFVRDITAGSTTRVSVSSSGVEGNFTSRPADITADGRYVAFASFSSNLVPSDTNSSVDIFVRDRNTNTTTRVSVSSTGAQAIPGGPGSEPHERPAISDDGRYIVFGSNATNLVPNDTNGVRDIFLRDVVSGTTTRLSVSSFMEESNDRSTSAAVSADGRFAAFWSTATNLVPDDFNGSGDVFVREVEPGLTTVASVSSAGGAGNLGGATPVSISSDGRFVVFPSGSTNLVTGDTNSGFDVFLRDTTLGTTELLSRTTSGTQAAGSHRAPSLSATGRYVVFDSSATTLVTGDTNARDDVFLRDQASPVTPSVVLDSPETGSSVFGTQQLTAAMLPGFTASRVDFLVDGAVVGSDTTAPYAFDWNTTVVNDGTRAVVARATLTGGGTSDSLPVSVRVINGATCDEKLDVDHQTGRIGADEHVRLGIYCIFNSSLVTGRHASTTPLEDPEAAISRVMRYWDQASQASKNEATQFLSGFDTGFEVPTSGSSANSASRAQPTPQGVVPGTNSCSPRPTRFGPVVQWCTYTTAKFRIEYPGEGAARPFTLSEVETIADSFHAALAKYTNSTVEQFPGVVDPLNYAQPDHYPVRVVVAPFIGSASGVSVTPPPDTWPTATDIYLHPDNLNLWHRPRHELLHVIQFNYVSDGNYFSGFGTGFWMEATAEWAAHQAVTPDMPLSTQTSYAGHLPEFLGDPEEHLLAHASFLDQDDHEYGAFILAEYLEERFASDFIRRTFERVGALDQPGMEAVDDVLRLESQPDGVASVLPDFWKRSYFLNAGPTGFQDSDLNGWIDILEADPLGRTTGDAHARARPQRQTFAFTGGLTREGAVSTEPGGATFVDLVHDVGRPVTLEIRLRNSEAFLLPPSAGSLKATLYSFSSYPSTCRAPVELSLTNGIASQSVGLGETCTFSTLVLNNSDMRGSTEFQRFTIRMSGAPRPGDVFVGEMGGRVGVYRPNGERVANLLTGTGGALLADGETIGVAFDSTNDFYATNFDDRSVSKFAPDGTLVGPFGTGYDSGPESIVFDPNGNAYVGHVESPQDVHKRAPDGTFIERLDVAFEDRGADHMALRPDGCTLVYTSEGSRVLQYDVCTRQQLPDFTTMTPKAFGIAVLPDGGIVVATTSTVRRFNAQGSQVQTYDVVGTNEWFGLGLDPDGTSFWVGDIRFSRVYRFDIATGQVLATIQTDAPPVTPQGDVGIGGIAVMPDIGGSASAPEEGLLPGGPAQSGSRESDDIGGVRR
jgi:sugar lactone lactonase YvrE